MKQELKAELVRKSIHALVAFAPLLASWSRLGTFILLLAGMAFYMLFEALMMMGFRIPFLSTLMVFASRRRDRGRFVLGPLTLGAGAFLSLLIFPPVPAAIAVYALAAGDSVSTLAGKAFGRLRPGFLSGKSVEGSFACFAAVFFCAWPVGKSLPAALIAAAAATLTEALPLRDWDNIAIPLAAGAAAWGGLLLQP